MRPQIDSELPNPVAAVIAAIETDIIRGRILPRTRLIEDHLMEDYDAKRHVVRAALAELQRLGVVVKPRHRGAELPLFDARALTDLYAMRTVLHRAAAQATPFPVPRLRLAELTQAMRAHAAAAGSGDLIRIHRENMRFHRLLYGLCDNPYLAESIRLHDWLSFPARAYGAADSSALAQACEEHGAMVDALRACDREALEKLSVQHMQRARQIYEAKFLAGEAAGR
ncbi:GntR family transcriptional regulator [Roseomonas xinghualingensis]|uniref:GntR family transcriptional regulator n=1 Tax=Roseomonas xinghualingensis TaxID=2986475 RepID=UPI0021F1D691|nr:GntR family transcriptional regulator [Roseomonas sp. SXEYE001]MCV4209798.1 GntR family transcriptional regulator [Roseomonas sp. SXEYE001]